MSSRLTADLLAIPAVEAVRVIACAQLGEVGVSYERFCRNDEDGLHDLRVALRRLRTWLRAFRPHVSNVVRRSTEERLKEIAAATNAARDAEVTVQWLGAQAPDGVRKRAGYRIMMEAAERERSAAFLEARETLEDGLPKATNKLGAELECSAERNQLDSSPLRRMAPVAGEVVHDQVEQLAKALSRIKSREDADAVHRARIAAKRLRYVLEPLDEELGVSDSSSRLKNLQQHLGEIHDAHRFIARIAREIGERAVRDARYRATAALEILSDEDRQRPAFSTVRPGLIDLGLRAHAAEASAFSEFRRQWGEQATPAFVAEVRRIAHRLNADPVAPIDVQRT